jgi:hypothetical protein
MIRIAKQTNLKPKDVIVKAAKFFGSEGQQLEDKERNSCCISFGGGGYVSISIAEEGERKTVVVETREFEYQAQRFLELL